MECGFLLVEYLSGFVTFSALGRAEELLNMRKRC